MLQLGPACFIFPKISVGFESTTALRRCSSPHCRLFIRFEHRNFNTSSQPLLVRARGAVAVASVNSRLPPPSSRPQGNAQQATGARYPLWSLIAMTNSATLIVRINLMVSNRKHYKSDKVKATKRSDKSFSILNRIFSLLSSIVFYQLTFSNHKGSLDLVLLLASGEKDTNCTENFFF